MAGLKQRADAGFALLDALVALFILLAGLGIAVGGIRVAARMTARQEERVLQMIEERNEQALAPALFGSER